VKQGELEDPNLVDGNPLENSYSSRIKSTTAW
jgi:hypothetical protein